MMDNHWLGQSGFPTKWKEVSGMSQWFYLNENTLGHISGLTIRLRQGSWVDPRGIDMRCASEISGCESARIIKAGLVFARKNPYALPTNSQDETLK